MSYKRREWPSREAAERDPELGLCYIWVCDSCGDRREEPAGYNEGGKCHCGGWYRLAGESYNG